MLLHRVGVCTWRSYIKFFMRHHFISSEELCRGRDNLEKVSQVINNHLKHFTWSLNGIDCTESIETKLEIVLTTDDTKAVVILMRDCIKFQRWPQISIILKAAQVCAYAGEVDILDAISSYLDVNECAVSIEYLRATANWQKGNIDTALEQFGQSYRAVPKLRIQILQLFTTLTYDVTAKCSYAVLMKIIQFSETLAHDCSDYRLLYKIWQCCFLSHWSCDHLVANDLWQKHCHRLMPEFNKSVPYILFIITNEDRYPVLQNVFDLVVDSNLQNHYSMVLRLLFEYRFKQNKWNYCAQLIRWACDNNVALPNDRHIELISLLINKKLPVTNKQIPCIKYQF